MASNNNNNDGFDDPNDGDGSWWWSSEAYTIKFAVLLSIFVVLIAYFLGGYLHAQRRIKKGLPPLRYHRWLLPRSQRARFDPYFQQQQQQQFAYYPVQDGYAMQGYPPPPPAYNPHAPPPPSYQPSEGGSKVMPSQDVYAAPVGPPPTTSNANPVGEEPTQSSSSGGFLSRFKRH